MKTKHTKTAGNGRDLFGAPLPMGDQRQLFNAAETTAKEARAIIKKTAAEIEAYKAKLQPPPSPAPSAPARRRWPPPWFAELPCDRRIKRQYKAEHTPQMFKE